MPVTETYDENAVNNTVANVSNKALATNVATLTTAAAHGFTAGRTVTVAGVDAVFNGTFVIVGTPTATTFTYAKTNADVTSAAATGTATSQTKFLASDSLGWTTNQPNRAINVNGVAADTRGTTVFEVGTGSAAALV